MGRKGLFPRRPEGNEPMLKKIILAAVVLPMALLSLTACKTKAQTGAAIGAGAGALGGYIIGNEADKDDMDDHYDDHRRYR